MKKSITTKIEKVFDNRVRLGIMAILMVRDWVEFVSLKEKLEVTDGALASHLSVLEKNDYIEVRKQFVGRRPQTSYSATVAGRKAFSDHLDILEQLIKGISD
jgi:predicted ArsR family transcriptional regulator